MPSISAGKASWDTLYRNTFFCGNFLLLRNCDKLGCLFNSWYYCADVRLVSLISSSLSPISHLLVEWLPWPILSTQLRAISSRHSIISAQECQHTFLSCSNCVRIINSSFSASDALALSDPKEALLDPWEPLAPRGVLGLLDPCNGAPSRGNSILFTSRFSVTSNQNGGFHSYAKQILCQSPWLR